MEEEILEFHMISKIFPGVKALDDVSFSVKAGTVHALIGENGAGKSTLMKVLFGIYKPEKGYIIYKGEKSTISNPRAALDVGISMIPQEVSPVNNLTVSSNIFLGKEITKGWKLVNQKALDEAAGKVLQEIGLDINPKEKMSNLSIANAQLVAIATSISNNSQVIIMDEPTSALTEKESNTLLDTIRKLRNKGVTIIYISHKLDEILSIADNYTVLRDGKSIQSGSIAEIDKSIIINLMVGREMDEFFTKEESHPGEVLLEVKNLSYKNEFRQINFSVKRGEILGFSGLIGSGRTELMEAVFGMKKPDSGEMFINGKQCLFNSPKDAIRAGIGFVTEDRKESGIFPELNISDNMIMPGLEPYAKMGLVDTGDAKISCTKQVKALQIKTPSLQQSIKNLSGGNQQKVLISRWLLMNPDILILDEPTRGIDVGSKAEIHKLISELAKSGKSIIMISSEMPEVLSMSDRIVVMHQGTISGELTRDEATQQRVMYLATGEAEANRERINE